MKIAFTCAAPLVLAGCSVVPPQAWNFDPTKPPAKESLAAPELAALTDRVAELQLERNAIRAKIAAEPDVWQRQGLYVQLHEVGMELSPLDRRLGSVSAGR